MLKHLAGELRLYYDVRSELAVNEDLLMRQHRIVVPRVMRPDILNKIHSGHQGIHKCRERAAQCVWWPRMSKEILEMVHNCNIIM